MNNSLLMKKYIVFTFIISLLSLFLPFFPATNNSFESINLLGFQYAIKYNVELYFIIIIVLLFNYFTMASQYVKYKRVIPVLITITVLCTYGALLLNQILIGGFQRGAIVLETYHFGYFISFSLFLVFNILVYVDAYKKKK